MAHHPSQPEPEFPRVIHVTDPDDSTGYRERAERLELVLQATNEGHWDWDLVTGEVYFSPRWKEMLGYRDDEVPNDVEEWRKRIHPDDAMSVELRLQLYLDGFLDTYELEHRLRHKDGSWRWIQTRGTSLRDEHGHVVRIVGAHQDVTDRKQVETEVRRRDSILDAVRFTAERFLTADISWTEGAHEVLTRLGRATGTSRAYVFENYVGPDGETWAKNTHEWAAPGIPPQITNPRLQAFDYRALGLKRQKELFQRGELIHGHVRDLSEEEAREFRDEGVLSFIVIPIFVNGAWWGFFGFDECVQEREFSAPEQDALKAAADTLGAAVARSKAHETSAWLAAIVESSEDAIIGETLDRHITSWNRGAERLFGYAAEEAIGRSIEFVIPDHCRYLAIEDFRKIARGEMIPPFEAERRRKDGSSVMVLLSLWPVRGHNGEIVGAASTARDISGQKQAEEALRRSQQSLSTLMSNLPGMAYRSVPEPEWRIEFVSEGAQDLTGYPPSRLIGVAGNSWIDLIHEDDRSALRHDVEAAIISDRPYHLTYRIRTASGEEKWVMEQGRGVRDASGKVTTLEGIVVDVTDRVQARQLLEQRVAERTRELSTLLDVSASVASTLELEPLIGVILEQFHNVVDYTGAAILLIEDNDQLRLLGYRGPITRSAPEGVLPIDVARLSREVIQSRHPLIIGDVHVDSPERTAHATTRDDDTDAGHVASWMGVPLMLRERVVGVLAVDHHEHDAYTQHHAELALAFASQAAVAIENAQLFGTTQEKAALEERQRLARELHDSVSQALFGIGLGARTARTVIEEDPAKAIPPLDYVLSLAEAGLAEMRALIFELRPEALQEEGIVAALQKQVAALRARYGIEVDAKLDEICPIPFETEEALYRIAQEAMHNTVKHARATRVELGLVREDDRLQLVIADDGKGFDVAGAFPGHLGLHTMRQRAERLGGTFTLQSAPGEGSRIEVIVPVPT